MAVEEGGLARDMATYTWQAGGPTGRHLGSGQWGMAGLAGRDLGTSGPGIVLLSKAGQAVWCGVVVHT